MRMLIEVGYTGNRATHLGVTERLGFASRSSTSAVCRPAITRPSTAFGASVANPFYGIPQFTTTALANSHDAGLATAAAISRSSPA